MYGAKRPERSKMNTLHHICDNCSSEFIIKYYEDDVEDSPSYCPFCAEYILEVDNIETEEDDD